MSQTSKKTNQLNFIVKRLGLRSDIMKSWVPNAENAKKNKMRNTFKIKL